MEINERVNGKCECDTELETIDVTVAIRDFYWGNIKGDIYKQEDLQQEFSLYRKKDDQDVIDNEIKESLANEITSRENADRELDAKIEAETSRATTKENELSTNLSNEIARAKSVEGTKLDKVSAANKVYGTDGSGAQITYDVSKLGKVDDVTYNSKSLVSNRVANLNGFITYSDEELS